MNTNLYPIEPNHIKIVQTYLPDYLKSKNLTTTTRYKYHCLNPNHTDNNPSMCLYKGRQDGKLRLKCQVCGLVLDLFNLVELVDHIQGFVNQYFYICNYFHLDPNNPIPSAHYEYYQHKKVDNQQILEYIDLCTTNKVLIDDKWSLRSIPSHIVEEYRLGYDETLDAYIIPVGDKGFIQRFNNDRKPKYNRSYDLRDYFFANRFYNSLPFIITEGEIDALSLLACDYPNVIALGGVTKLKHFYEEFLKNNSATIILALDLDEAGSNAFTLAQIISSKVGLSPPINLWNLFIEPLSENIKDINDLLIFNQPLLQKTLMTIKKDYTHEKNK